jgi:hypothetical protein
MKVKFSLRPLTLDIEHASKQGGSLDPRRVGLQMYRFAARRMIAELLDENKRLRHGRRLERRPLWLEAVTYYFERRGRPPHGTAGPALDRLAPGDQDADTSSGYHGGGGS